MKLREWATPLTIGAFALVSVTGVLMFFHLDTAFNKPAHEWVGLVMVAAVAVHAFANWTAFKRYFLMSGPGRALIGLGVATLALSFIPLAGGGQGASPPVLAMRAVTRAPIAQVVALTGRPAADVMADLEKAGIRVPDERASLDSVVRGDRELQGRAMRALFATP